MCKSLSHLVFFGFILFLAFAGYGKSVCFVLMQVVMFNTSGNFNQLFSLTGTSIFEECISRFKQGLCVYLVSLQLTTDFQ